MDTVVAEVAGDLARYFRATLTFTQFVPTDAPAVELQQSRAYLKISRLCEHKSEILLLRGNTEVDSISASKGFDLMIVGARPHNSMRNIFFKSSEDLIVDRSICSALP